MSEYPGVYAPDMISIVNANVSKVQSYHIPVLYEYTDTGRYMYRYTLYCVTVCHSGSLEFGKSTTPSRTDRDVHTVHVNTRGTHISHITYHTVYIETSNIGQHIAQRPTAAVAW